MTGFANTVASLPMYDAPRAALVAFWDGVREHLARNGLADAPEGLTEPEDLETHWRAPNLLLSQTCGLPVSTTLRDDVVVLCTPHYAAPGCDGPLYRSLVVVREDDTARALSGLRGRRAAVNDFGSHSGCSQLFGLVAPLDRHTGFFSEILVSGAHRASLEFIRTGRADVAAIDCVTYALAFRDRPETLNGLRIIGRSPAAPGLPFIASKQFGGVVTEALRASLFAAMRDPELVDVRAALLISGVSLLPIEAYDVCRRAAAAAAVPRHASPGRPAPAARPAAR